MSPAPQPVHNPIPVQAPQITKEQLADPAVMNVLFQQIFTAINQGNGTLGPVVQPSGLDVKGARVSNVGAPKEAGDAISSGHAATNYGPDAQAEQLDLGKPHALKGLTQTFALANQATQNVTALQKQVTNIITGTVGASGSVTFSNGLILKWGTTPTGNPHAFTFPAAFPNACFIVLAICNIDANTSNYCWVGGVTATGFNIYNNGSTPPAFWFAIGS